jgi:DNA-binding NtrC family response regulator
VKAADPSTVVVIATAVREVRTAVEALKRGAYDYLTKPFDVDDILGLAARAFEKRALERQVVGLRSALTPSGAEASVGFEGMVGRHPEMVRLYRLVTQVAPTPGTVLITGESGTGKELVARAVHRQSDRRHQPFVPVNVAALPETLVESELFGHEKGAFTGAHARRLGRFELAHGGTVFLDEIGSLRLDLQAKLLRALQEREIERVGGGRPVPVDVRVIAATNVNLRQAVRDRTFRDDLFYRLNVVPIHVPPLRERREDIPHLVEHFVRRTARECSRDVRAVSAGALDALVRYDWPGNVRELDNVIYRAVVLAREPVLQLPDLPLDVVMPEARAPAGDDAGLPLREACDRFERQYVLRVLERSQWNVSRAARLLGVHRNTILTKLAGWGVQRPGGAASGDQALSL